MHIPHVHSVQIKLYKSSLQSKSLVIKGRTFRSFVDNYRSHKGTVRGVRNMVRVGIANFLLDQTKKVFFIKCWIFFLRWKYILFLVFSCKTCIIGTICPEYSQKSCSFYGLFVQLIFLRKIGIFLMFTTSQHSVYSIGIAYLLILCFCYLPTHLTLLLITYLHKNLLINPFFLFLLTNIFNLFEKDLVHRAFFVFFKISCTSISFHSFQLNVIDKFSIRFLLFHKIK